MSEVQSTGENQPPTNEEVAVSRPVQLEMNEPNPEAFSFKVYKPSSASNPLPPPPPEEYFTPTAADLQAAQSQLAARTQALTNAPLQLRAAREAAEKAKRERWPNTTIRIRFTDRTMLEKVFPSTDKIKSVYAFVRNSLREGVKPIKFILYQPPRRDLKVSDVKVKNLSLAELQLAPSSVLLLRFEDESLNGSSVPAPLADHVISQAQDLPLPPQSSETPPPAESTSKRIGGAISGGLSSGEKKIPKWLKLGKK